MDVKDKPLSLDISDADELNRFRNQEPERIIDRPSGRDARISKTVRMRLRFSEMLRDESYRRTVVEGQKVSEADLLDEALTEWRMKHDIHSD